MPGVFISYRRADSGRWCRRLSDHLALRFGDDLVFRDVDDLKPGMRWRDALQAALRRADVALILIGPAWLDRRHRRRLFDPRDVLRREIRLALAGRRRKVVPVLVGGAPMPASRALPAPLRGLCEWQACPLRDARWRADVARLVERLRALMPALPAGAVDALTLELIRDQNRYFDQLDGRPAAALDIARETLRKLNRLCPLDPLNASLQLTRGYTHKNVAQALARLNRPGEADAVLGEAERTFRTAVKERPRDAGAWNGLGSVEAVRGIFASGRDDRGSARRHFERALRCVDKALALEPRYPAALQDREQIQAALGR